MHCEKGLGEWGEFTGDKRLFLTHHPWFSRPGHPFMPLLTSSGIYCPTQLFYLSYFCAAVFLRDVIFILLYGLFYIADYFYTMITFIPPVSVPSPARCSHFTASSRVFCKSQALMAVMVNWKSFFLSLLSMYSVSCSVCSSVDSACPRKKTGFLRMHWIMMSQQ